MYQEEHILPDGRTLHIREAVPEDSQALLAYVEAVSGETDFLTFGPGEFELSTEEEAQFIHACAASVNSLYLVAIVGSGVHGGSGGHGGGGSRDVGGAIVGTLTLAGGQRRRVGHCGELGMSVRKSHWGLGIGARLLDALIAWARRNELLTKLDLRVRTDNHRAIDLYRRKGFTVEGTLRRQIYANGTHFDQYWMGLEL